MPRGRWARMMSVFSSQTVEQPSIPAGLIVDLERKAQREDTEFSCLLRLFELYSDVQVQADTIYHNRTSIITLTQGLLFLGYQGIMQVLGQGMRFLALAISCIGIVLSILWLAFEQRNEIYFKARGAVLCELEKDLLARAAGEGRAFRPFWTVVPQWVGENAAWYQRCSAPLILRVLIPALFVVSWTVILAFTARIPESPAKTMPPPTLPQAQQQSFPAPVLQSTPVPIQEKVTAKEADSSQPPRRPSTNPPSARSRQSQSTLPTKHSP